MIGVREKKSEEGEKREVWKSWGGRPHKKLKILNIGLAGGGEVGGSSKCSRVVQTRHGYPFLLSSLCYIYSSTSLETALSTLPQNHFITPLETGFFLQKFTHIPGCPRLAHVTSFSPPPGEKYHGLI